MLSAIGFEELGGIARGGRCLVSVLRVKISYIGPMAQVQTTVRGFAGFPCGSGPPCQGHDVTRVAEKRAEAGLIRSFRTWSFQP